MAIPDTTTAQVPTPAPDFGTDYVSLELTTDEQTLADGAITRLQTVWPDWQPNDGDFEVVLIETLAPLAQNAVAQASNMPPAALIALGELIGIPYSDGVQAQTTVTLTFIDDAGGYLVAAGSEISLGGYAFSTTTDVTSVAGAATLPGVEIIAEVVGSDADGLTTDQSGWASITLPVWVQGVATESPTVGGEDPDDDQVFLNKVSRELQLRARVVVTLPDYEIVALDTPGVGRVYAMTDSARNVTVYVTDPQGEPCTDDVKDQLAAVYATKRLVNVTVAISDPTYTEVDITWEAVAQSGFAASDIVARGNAALAQLLSPAGWGAPLSGDPGSANALSWDNDNVVRVNKIIQTLGSVTGLDYVVGEPLINGAAEDFTMDGDVALPQPGTFDGTVNTP
jgi:hypothetical protein